MPSTERRLAAILSADVVGYSRLMAEDEAGTIRTLTDYRSLISNLVTDHHGRVVDAPGDNLLAEFPNALDAVQCAVETQRVLQVRNQSLAEDRRMLFRIGVHLGDITAEAGRIYGDGVNIAARLEGLAEPGGICISATVQEQVESKFDVVFEDLGEQEVKNIPKPVRVYRVRLETAALRPSVQPRVRRTTFLVAGAAVLLVMAGLLVWRLLAPTDDRFTVPGFGDVPAIAVLPFDNLSKDPEQEYFADGIAEELITRLSSFRDLPIIARNSSFIYKGQAVDVEEVGRELGARYVVEGSVQKVADRIRVSAQLIDATTGHHVLAERYDRELRDIFALQDEITEAIAWAIHPEVLRSEMNRAARKPTENLEAYDLVLRGRSFLNKVTAADNARGRSLFQEAAELAPESSLPFAGISNTHFYDLLHQWTDSVPASLAALKIAAERCLELDERSPSCHQALGDAYRWAGQGDRMIASYRRSVELNPSYVPGLNSLGFALALAGRPEESIENLQRAVRLSPGDRFWTAVIAISMSAAHFGAGRYEDAIGWADRALPDRRMNTFGWRLLAVSHAHLGRREEARAAAEEVLRSYPEFSVSHVAMEFAAADPVFLEKFLDGLREAGVPEG